jgi:hypothetical protein
MTARDPVSTNKDIAMKHSNDSSRVASSLLDPRFEYTPAAATNIAATWKRFGFDPSANEQRRQRWLGSFTPPASDPLSLATRTIFACSD